LPSADRWNAETEALAEPVRIHAVAGIFDQNGAGLLILETADDFPQNHADPARADHADHGSRAYVRFEAIERIRNP
jgi:hypothetical protein